MTSPVPYLSEIRIFGSNFCPRGWRDCDGQLLPIVTNQNLFSLLGVTYGGDGRTTFALPDLRGRAAIHEGEGPGLHDQNLGQKGGAEVVTLTDAQTPEKDPTCTCPLHDHNSTDHNHEVKLTVCKNNSVQSETVKGLKDGGYGFFGFLSCNYISKCFEDTEFEQCDLEPQTITTTAAGNEETTGTDAECTCGYSPTSTTAHTNMQPYLTLTFCICVDPTFCIFPPRN